MASQPTEILLLNIPFAMLNSQRDSLSRFVSRAVPLGLFCLAAIAPERIKVIDFPGLSQISEVLSSYDAQSVKAVILHLQPEASADQINTLLERFRSFFPLAAIGCGQPGEKACAAFDFAIKGTGKTAILRILRGDQLRGMLDTLADDLDSPLNVPDEQLFDSGQELASEKWFAGKTIEIFQPWLGLLEHSHEAFVYPGAAWLAAMVDWLKKSGYVFFHFCPSGLRQDNLHELRSVMLNCKARFAVSFMVDHIEHISTIGYPLQQIWLHGISLKNFSKAVELMRQIRQSDCQSCLLVDRQWLKLPEWLPLLALADRMVVGDFLDWPKDSLKHLTWKFWSYRQRFFARLIGLKSASELIVFMKTAYVVLEILFSSDKNGGCKQ